MARTQRRKGISKPLLVFFSSPAIWGSCRIITPNLAKAYQTFFDREVETLVVPSPRLAIDWFLLAKRIYDLHPQCVIWVEHHPHPEMLLEYLVELYREKSLPPLFVHVFGDFTLNTGKWLRSEDFLKQMRVSWICASERQTLLISRFMKDGNRNVHQCHFPVDTEFFYFDHQVRNAVRHQWGVSRDETVFLYAGRMSLQKNIFQLVKDFSIFLKMSGAKAKLLLVGQFDDIGAPLFWGPAMPGFFFAQWQELLSHLEPDVRMRIKWIGFADREQLFRCYQAADAFVSLSTHHDEDFGMAPAEALCCGLSGLLSDWGGYASFATIAKDACVAVSTQITEAGLQLSSMEVLQGFFSRLRMKRSAMVRSQMSGIYESQLSIEAAGKKLSEIYSVTPSFFKGFTPLLKRHASAFANLDGGQVVFPGGPKRGTFYEEIYKSYASS